jgi:hypothetical protein
MIRWLIILALLAFILCGCAAKPDKCKAKASTKKLVTCEWIIDRR